jgi:hypothetical protein
MDLSFRTFPDRIAELGFTTQLPADWIAHELPAEQPDFSSPTTFFPLAIVTAPHAAIVFAFAARPAFDDGTLHDQAWYLLTNNGLTPRAIGPHPVAGVPGLVGEATQPSDLGPMVVRFAFFEDGGRLVNLTLTAPDLLADAVYPAWSAMLASFTLATPKGSRFTEATVMPAPTPATVAEPESPAPPEAAPEAAGQEAPTFASFAFADTPASLDPEAKVNANLRDRGIGLVPNVVATDDAAKCATLAAGAIAALVQVPYGWYVIDDGKRTLVLHPKDEVQINLDLLHLKEGGYEGLLDELEAQVRSDYPDPHTLRVGFGQIRALGVRNIAVDGQPIEQVHMLHPYRTDTLALRARVTTSPEQAVGAINLAQLILEGCTFGPPAKEQAPPAPAEGPAWWQQALALERQDRFDEAEEAIRNGVPHLAFAHAIADMYRLRMLRLKGAGDAPGALDAFKRSSNYIFFYASQATSGGEGTALSAERDAFRAQLVAEYGSDPEVNA